MSGADSGARTTNETVEPMPADLQLVAMAWESLSDEAKRSILEIVRGETRADGE